MNATLTAGHSPMGRVVHAITDPSSGATACGRTLGRDYTECDSRPTCSQCRAQIDNERIAQ